MVLFPPVANLSPSSSFPPPANLLFPFIINIFYHKPVFSPSSTLKRVNKIFQTLKNPINLAKFCTISNYRCLFHNYYMLLFVVELGKDLKGSRAKFG